MCRKRAWTRPARYEQVWATSECVESLSRIEIPKNKNFQNFLFLTSWTTIATRGTRMFLISPHRAIFWKSYRKASLFSRPPSVNGAIRVVHSSSTTSKNDHKTQPKIYQTDPITHGKREICCLRRIWSSYKIINFIIALFHVPRRAMDRQRSSDPSKNSRHAHPNSIRHIPKMIKRLALATPDELEGDSMLPRQLTSRWMTLGTLETRLASGMNDFLDFASCRDHTPPRAKPS